MRTCSRCGAQKELSEFAWRHRRRGTRQPWWRTCHRAVDALRYSALSEALRTQRRSTNRARVRALRRRLWAFLAGQQCLDCGESDPVVLELDHVGPKRAAVSDLVKRGCSWDLIRAEISNCEVRCANCHRRRTAERGQWTSTPARQRPGRDSNSRPAASKAAALSAELPGLRNDHSGGDRELRLCTRCLKIKSVTNFYERSAPRASLHSWCKACHNACVRDRYARRRVSEIARLRENRRRYLLATNALLRGYLADHPCVDCGERDAPLLEFDHRGDKRGDISYLRSSGRPWRFIESEIAKCEVRCANCHRRRTAREQGIYEEKRNTRTAE